MEVDVHDIKYVAICYYCEEPYGNGEKRRSADHIIPSSAGGYNRKVNKLFCCQACNNAKGNMTPEEFMVDLIRTHDRLGFKHDGLKMKISKTQLLIEYTNQNITEMKGNLPVKKPIGHIPIKPKKLKVTQHKSQKRIEIRDGKRLYFNSGGLCIKAELVSEFPERTDRKKKVRKGWYEDRGENRLHFDHLGLHYKTEIITKKTRLLTDDKGEVWMHNDLGKI